MKRLILVILMSGMFVGQAFPIAGNELLSQVTNSAAPVVKEAFFNRPTLKAIGIAAFVGGLLNLRSMYGSPHSPMNPRKDEMAMDAFCDGAVFGAAIVMICRHIQMQLR